MEQYKIFVSGFLKTGATGSAQGNFGLMDLVAGLHWLRENLPAFGGDPERVTLMGHSTGAALVNFIAVSPVAKGKLNIPSFKSAIYLLLSPQVRFFFRELSSIL